MSLAKAFVRIQRLLSIKRVTLIVCGVSTNLTVGKALQQVDIWTDCGTGVEVFGTLNEAIESDDGNGTHPANKAPAQSPPREPTYSLIKTFLSHTNDPELMARLAAYLSRIELHAGNVLWKQGDLLDGLYMIESGVLQTNYDFGAHSAPVQESITAGKLAGELSALWGAPRNATVVAERGLVVWKMSVESYERLEWEQGDVAKAFVTLVLKAAKQDYDVLLAV
ncbi:hypothetical protein FRC09_012417, partial [Ceratobasidium sp. 395]